MEEEKQTTVPRSPQKRALLIFVAGIVLLMLLAWWREGGTSGSGADDDLPYLARLNVGQPAPAFRAVSLAGKEVSFPEDYRGKIVLLDFWATWCPPCRAELPHLRDAYQKFHDQGFEILGVSLDASQGISAESVRRFLKDHDAPWQVIYERANEIANQYRFMGIPAGFLVDGDTGIVLATGSQVRGDALAETIASAFKKKRP
jgi:peroxiredoxin